MFRVFRHTVKPYDEDFKTVGGGASINARADAKKTRFIGQFAFGAGLGRYIGGLVPDVTFTADSSIQPLGTTSWVAGVEQQVSSIVSLAGYYSGVTTDAAAHLDTDGRYIGFGFPGSSNFEQQTGRRADVHELAAGVQDDRPRFGADQSAGLLARTRALVAHDRPRVGVHVCFFAQVRYNLP